MEYKDRLVLGWEQEQVGSFFVEKEVPVELREVLSPAS